MAANFFQARAGSRAVLVIAPALGVPQKFYAKLAIFLADAGISALSFDYRGCGENPMRHNSRLVEWGSQDIDAAIHCALELQAGPVFLLGHSIGAQLVALAANAGRLTGLACAAGSFPWLGRWPVAKRLPLALNFYAVIPLLAALRREFPAQRLGLASFHLPSAVMREWARWIRCEEYLLDPKFGIDRAHWQRLQLPLLAYGFADDDLVPRASFEKMLDAYSNCAIEPRFLDPAAHNWPAVGHSGFFREQHRETLWEELKDWLLGQL